jgi:Per os infectivity factor 3
MINLTVLNIIIVLFVFLIIYFYVSISINRLNRNYTNDVLRANRSTPMEFVFERNGLVDCNTTHLPCVSDRQCADNCSFQNAMSSMVCVEGYCSTRDTVGSGPDQIEIFCDPNKGLFKAFIASEFVVNQICISLYRDIVDDTGEIRPYVCESGRLNLFLTQRQFSVNDCSCNFGFTRMLFQQTGLVRTIPVCVPNRVANIYTKIYERV